MISNTLLKFDMDFEAVLDEAETYGMTSEQVAAFSDAFARYGIEPQEMMEESTTYRHSLEYISRWITSYDLTIPILHRCPLK